MRVDEFVLSYFPGAKRSGGQYMAPCPAHADKSPSLSIRQGKGGNVLLKCFAGCETNAVCEAIGVPMSALMGDPSAKTTNGKSKGKIVATYPYRDENGNLLMEAVRLEPKSFRQRKPDGNGGWKWSVEGVRTVPYRLPELLADPTRVVFIVEGEKDVHRLAAIEILATCNAGGALKWTADHAVHLKDRYVVILPDNDTPGQQHAEKVAISLQGVARQVKVVALPELPEKGDVSDWIDAGGTKDQLRRLIDATLLWQPGTEAWPDVDSIENRHLPPFPTEVLPTVLRDFVEAESIATQTPADLAGLMCLAVCAATIARRVRVEARSGFSEPTNLYVTVVLDPGNRKSAVFSDATRPLREIEAEAIEDARPTVARLQSERRQDENRLRALEKKGAEDPEARHQAMELAAELEEKPAAVLPRLMVDDATGEKMGMILAEQGGRIASFSPEGTVFDLMAGMYSKSGLPQMDTYLKGHNGDDLTTDRVGRASVHVKNPAITCAYTVQKSVIEGMNETKAFRGRGLLGRYLYAMPESWIGRRQVAPPAVPENIRARYDQLVRRLAHIDGPIMLQLTKEAAVHFQRWEVEAEGMLADGGPLESMKDWGAKLHGATLRIAGILHCVASTPDQPISEEWVEAAVALSRYLIPHAEAVFDAMVALENATADGASYLLRWIDDQGLREFSRRDAHQHGRRKFASADEVDAPIAELVKRGYIRLKPTEPQSTNSPGRKPSPRYEVNPAFFESESARSCPQNTQNVNQSPPIGSSEDFEDTFQPSKAAERVQVTI